MKSISHNALRFLNVLIVVSLLLGAVTPVAEAAKDQAPVVLAEDLSFSARVGETNSLVQTESSSHPAQSDPPYTPPALHVRAHPERVAPGEVTTIHIDLVGQGTEIIEDVTLTNELPEGLVYVQGSATGDVIYTAEDNSLTWEVGDVWPAKVVQVGFQVEVLGLDAGEAVTNMARASNIMRGEMTTETAILRIVSPVGNTAVVSPEWGGWLRTEDGRVEVDAPPGAVSETTNLLYVPLQLTLNNFPRLLDVFSVRAFRRFRTVPEFAEPVELTYNYTETLGEYAPRYLKLFYRDIESGEWMEHPIILHEGEKELVAYVTQATRYAVVVDEDDEDFRLGVLTPSVLGFAANLWTGDSSYGYPLSLPPASAGTTPSMALIYSSGAANNMFSAASPWDSELRPAQSGDFGLGWSLQGKGAVTRGMDGTYRLSLPSGSYRLEHESGATWKTVPESFLQIEHDSDKLIDIGSHFYDCDDGQIQFNLDAYGMDPWTVRTPDGWEYQFGGEATEQYPDVAGSLPKAGETAAYWRGNVGCFGGQAVKLQAHRWNLVKVTPSVGGEWVYEYYGDTKNMDKATGYENKLCEVVPKNDSNRAYPRDAYVRHTRLKTITYGGGQNQVEVLYFEDESRDDPDGIEKDSINCRSQWMYSEHTANGIVVRAREFGSGDWKELRRYDLTTEAPDNEADYQFTRLAEIVETSETGTGVEQLPPTVFTYNTGAGGAPLAEVMRMVDNGYGANVTIESDRIECYQGQLFCYPYDGPRNGRIVVTDRIVRSMPGALESWQRYEYEEGTYWYPVDEENPDAPMEDEKFQFWGFGLVTETLAEGNPDTSPALRKIETHFNQTEEELKGKRDEEFIRDGSNVELQHTINTWTLPAEDPKFARLDRIETHQDAQPVLAQDLKYKAVYQNGHQCGNLTDVVDVLWDTNTGDWSTTPYRSAYTMYYPNIDSGAEYCNQVVEEDTNVYITNKPGQVHIYEEQYDGGPDNMRHQSLNYYDGATSVTTPPTQGLLTKQTSGLSGLWQSTEYEYSTIGNLSKMTDANGHSSETFYDSAFQAYPVCTVNARGDSVVRRYFGVPGSAPESDCVTTAGSAVNPSIGHVFGRVEDVTDGNGAVTSTEYDVWGRVSKMWRPGEGVGADPATEEVYYTDFSSAVAPTLVHTKQREDAGGASIPSYLENWQFYDGLGRVIQTQSEYTGTLRSLVDKSYGPYGTVTSTTVPYVATLTGDTYEPPNPTNHATQYDYDALGRNTVVTNPNNTTVNSYYNVLQTAVIDENEHQTITENDAFGRHIRTDQYDGEYTTPDWTSESYFHADYDYDVLDNLLVVTNRAGQSIVMQYDALSRKTDMNDPNMGDWSYGYDAVGNLTSQTDARVCVTTLDYDVLNRLTDKTYSGAGACGTTPGVSYTYDEFDGVNQFGRGRRTGMSDGSGNTAWVYDRRGRVTGETKTIGTDVFTTGYGYDAADRVTEMTYPGNNHGGSGEPVAFAYNNQGLLDSVTGYEAYVVSSSYDEASRLTERVSQKYYSDPSPDSFWTTTYAYHPWDNPNLGRLWTINASGTGETGTEIFQDLSYAYDPVGNVEVIGDNVSGQTRDFDYDALDRLTFSSASVGDGGGVYEEAYEYYRAGHFQRKWDPTTDSDEAKCLTEAEAAGCYKYEQGPRHAVSDYYVATDQANTYGYDANGNMTSRTVDGVSYTLTYDAENRLIGVRGGGPTVTFTYDGDGNRVKKDEGGVVTHYPGRHYGATVGSGSTKYYHADGQLIAFDRSADYDPEPWGTRYVFRDHLGSTSIVVNGRGLKLWEDRYLPFGDVRYTYRKDDDTNFPVQTQYRYTSQWFEDGIGASAEDGLDRGLYFYGARWFDPSIARFIQPDTIVPEPGNPQALNRYTYARSNPLRYVDPTGHQGMPPGVPNPFEWFAELLGAPNTSQYADQPGLREYSSLSTDVGRMYTEILRGYGEGSEYISELGLSLLTSGVYDLQTGLIGENLSGKLSTGERTVRVLSGAIGIVVPMSKLLGSGAIIGRTHQHHWIAQQTHPTVKTLYPEVTNDILHFTEPIDEGFHRVLHGKWGSRYEAYNSRVIQWLSDYGAEKSLDEFLDFIRGLREEYIELYIQYLSGG